MQSGKRPNRTIAADEGGIPQRETQEVFLLKHAEEAREGAASGLEHSSNRSPLSEGEIPDGWEEAATAERRRAGLPDVDLRVEWRKLVIYAAGERITLGSLADVGDAGPARPHQHADRRRSTAVVNPETLPNAAPLPGDERQQRQARDWVAAASGCATALGARRPTSPAAAAGRLVAWCLRERAAAAA